MLRTRLQILLLTIAFAVPALISSSALAVSSEKSAKGCAVGKLRVIQHYTDCRLRSERRMIKNGRPLDVRRCINKAERRWEGLAEGVCAQAYGIEEVPGPTWEQVSLFVDGTSASLGAAHQLGGTGELTDANPCAPSITTAAADRPGLLNDCFKRSGPSTYSNKPTSGGVLLHQFDDTGEVPNRWIPGGGESHSDVSSSSSYINPTISNLYQTVKTRIAVYAPSNGGVIYNPSTIQLKCMFYGDTGSDSRGEGGCGCAQTQSWTTNCGTTIPPLTCTAACETTSSCPHCDGYCISDDTSFCAYRPSMLKEALKASTQNCINFRTNSHCFNEALVDASGWKDSPKQYFPQTIFAFFYTEQDTGSEPAPAPGVPAYFGKADTQLAWTNFVKIYGNSVPLVKLDLENFDKPFTIACTDPADCDI